MKGVFSKEIVRSADAGSCPAMSIYAFLIVSEELFFKIALALFLIASSSWFLSKNRMVSG